MPDAESGGRALLLDHSVLGGRRIRVEPTAKGSGNATGICACGVCVCVFGCVCVRERERERSDML
jgi:hypothetical protein